MALRDVVAGLDIGTSNVAAAVVRVAAPKQPLGLGQCPSLGLRKGIVVDVEGMAQSVRQAVELAAGAAGVKVSTACIGFSGHGVNVFTRRVEISLGVRGKVTAGDVADLHQMLCQLEVPPGRRVLQVLPVEFSLDGIPFKGTPVGRRCSRLSLEAKVITADSQLIERLIEGVNRAGLKVVEITLSPLAVAEGVLRAVEKELGVALVDFGGGTTAVALFKNGGLWDMAVIPVGGDHITIDLAIGLHTSLGEAEKVKCKVGLMAQAEEISLKMYAKGSPIAAMQIIESRVMEILDLVQRAVVWLSGGLDLPGGIVLCGGGSLLKGLPEVATSALRLPVRLTEEPKIQAACWLASYAAVKMGLKENRRLNVTAGDFCGRYKLARRVNQLTT